MKNIFNTISALFFLASFIGLNVYLNNGNQHQPVVVKDHVFSPIGSHFSPEQTGALPTDLNNLEKSAEGRHVGNSKVIKVRKAYSREVANARLTAALTKFVSYSPFTKAMLRPFAHYNKGNAVPVHLRNCVWLI